MEKKAQVTEMMYQKLEKDAKRNWDLFYKANKTNFYKDRHYIKFEFAELAQKIGVELKKDGSSSSEEAASTTVVPPGEEYVLLDAGCGVGNGFYPLYREYLGRLRVHACDFSPRAVDFVKQNELYNTEKINANVCDLVNDPSLPFPENTAHFGLFLFVLSAISPENHASVAKKLYDQMSPEGGLLYFRDYGRYDLAQLRLA